MERKQYQSVGIAFPPDTLAEIDQLAAERRVSRTELVRAALSVGLPLMKMGMAINTRRTIQILEHTQLVLSLIAERQYPEEAGEILQMATRNAADYHG